MPRACENGSDVEASSELTVSTMMTRECPAHAPVMCRSVSPACSTRARPGHRLANNQAERASADSITLRTNIR